VVDYASATVTLWPLESKNPAPDQCAGAQIPMEHTEEDNQLPVGSFKAGVRRFRLLWDTGASYSALPNTLVEKWNLQTRVRGPGSPQFYRSTPLSVAGQDLGPIEFVVLPLKLSRDFDGLLGGNFFEKHVVCLDYARRVVRVR